MFVVVVVVVVVVIGELDEECTVGAVGRSGGTSDEMLGWVCVIPLFGVVVGEEEEEVDEELIFRSDCEASDVRFDRLFSIISWNQTRDVINESVIIMITVCLLW